MAALGFLIQSHNICLLIGILSIYLYLTLYLSLNVLAYDLFSIQLTSICSFFYHSCHSLITLNYYYYIIIVFYSISSLSLLVMPSLTIFLLLSSKSHYLFLTQNLSNVHQYLTTPQTIQEPQNIFSPLPLQYSILFTRFSKIFRIIFHFYY